MRATESRAGREQAAGRSAEEDEGIRPALSDMERPGVASVSRSLLTSISVGRCKHLFQMSCAVQLHPF